MRVNMAVVLVQRLKMRNKRSYSVVAVIHVSGTSVCEWVCGSLDSKSMFEFYFLFLVKFLSLRECVGSLVRLLLLSLRARDD